MKVIGICLVIIGTMWLMGTLMQDETMVLKNEGTVMVNGTQYQKVLTKDWGYCLVYDNGRRLKVKDKIKLYEVENP